jgi:hypothetical protein
MEAKIILEDLNNESCKWTSSVSDTLKTKFDISPQDFIKFAELDLSNDYEHNIINALSNSKRALDCQLDTLLVAFAYYKKSQRDFWSFPKKITLISELGILAPRVLHKVNKQRNLLEHQFIKPLKGSVEDFLDIAMLFIASTDRYSLKFITQLSFYNEVSKKHYILKNEYAKELFEITIKEDNKKDEPKNEPVIISIDSSDPNHKLFLKTYLKAY